MFIPCSGRPTTTFGNGAEEVGLHSLVALGLLAAGLVATGAFPVLSTVTALVGIAAMIYGVVAGVMVVFNRDDDGPPD